MLFSLLAVLAPTAFAANCDSQLATVSSLTPENVAGAYTALAKCDRKTADTNFLRFLEKATDADALTALELAAIDNDIWTPVWGSLSKIASYEARDEVAQNVGAACETHPKVVTFLQGAYAGLKDIEFQQWDDAFAACSAAPLWTWVETQVQTPPTSKFDQKYEALLQIYVKQKKVEALPALQAGAIKAGTAGGPFEAILMKMGDAVAPSMGGSITPESQAKLSTALVDIAKAVPATMARTVADQLALSGADADAAKLLPNIYPDRVQKGGGFLYGAIAIESGTCEGKPSAILHYTTVSEPGKRWAILPELEAPMRASKAKLKGCTMEEPWPVLQTPEPVKSAADVESWLASVQAQWLKDHAGGKVATQKEKAVALP